MPWRSRAGRRRAAGAIAPPPISGVICGACHRSGGRAAGAVVAERFHPASAAAGVKGGEASAAAAATTRTAGTRPMRPTAAARRRGDASTKFLVRSAAGPADLCAGCHAAQAAVAGTPARPDAGRGRRHGAGSARACHSVHGAQPLAVAPAQPQKPGAKPAPGGDPCEVCHAAGKMASGATVGERGHPVGVSPGQDYGPDLPLYGVTGRRQAGRKDRLRDLPRPAPLGAGRRLRGDFEGGDELPAAWAPTATPRSASPATPKSPWSSARITTCG